MSAQPAEKIRGTREDTYSVSVTLDGVTLGVWDKMSGGELDSDEYKYKPGAMAPSISLGGTKTPGNITISRNYRLSRDGQIVARLFAAVGKGRVVATKTPLDSDGNVWAGPGQLVYRGTLKRVTPPTHDSESTSPGFLEIEITPDGDPSAG